MFFQLSAVLVLAFWITLSCSRYFKISSGQLLTYLLSALLRYASSTYNRIFLTAFHCYAIQVLGRSRRAVNFYVRMVVTSTKKSFLDKFVFSVFFKFNFLPAYIQTSKAPYHVLISFLLPVINSVFCYFYWILSALQMFRSRDLSGRLLQDKLSNVPVTAMNVF